MTTNQMAITAHASTYIAKYTEEHNCTPTSWFSFFNWLSRTTGSSSFNASDVELAKLLLQVA